jgi:hypothetical protein
MTVPLTIDSTAMQAIVSKAILEGIDQNQRDALLEQAVRYLLVAPPKQGYGAPEPKTPLQSAFDQAVGVAVNGVAREMVEGNQRLQQRIRELMSEAIESILMEGDTSLADSVRQSLGEAVSNYRNTTY